MKLQFHLFIFIIILFLSFLFVDSTFSLWGQQRSNSLPLYFPVLKKIKNVKVSASLLLFKDRPSCYFFFCLFCFWLIWIVTERRSRWNRSSVQAAAIVILKRADICWISKEWWKPSVGLFRKRLLWAAEDESEGWWEKERKKKAALKQH